jgi:hypothetical protein
LASSEVPIFWESDPIPSRLLCIKPILYHNIAEDIPEDRQKLIKRSYWIWFGTLK